MIRRSVTVVAFLSLAACGGGVSLRVPKKSLDALPVDERLDLLDAENDLFVAIDKHDDAVEAVRDAREAYRRAASQVAQAVRDLDRSSGSSDPEAVVAREELVEAKLHRAWLDRSIDLAEEALAVADEEVLVARARLERAKAQAVERAKVPGAASLSMRDFDAQVVRLERREKSLRDDLANDRKHANEERGAWLSESRKLSDMTGGALGSPWVE